MCSIHAEVDCTKINLSNGIPPPSESPFAELPCIVRGRRNRVFSGGKRNVGQFETKLPCSLLPSSLSWVESSSKRRRLCVHGRNGHTLALAPRSDRRRSLRVEQRSRGRARPAHAAAAAVRLLGSAAGNWRGCARSCDAVGRRHCSSAVGATSIRRSRRRLRAARRCGECGRSATPGAVRC